MASKQEPANGPGGGDDPPSGGRAAIAALGRRATAHYNAGRRTEALAVCREALALEPGRADVLAFAAMLALDLGDHAQAAELYGETVTAKPDYAEAHYNLGNALKSLGRPDDAMAAYRRALELKPDLAEAHNNLGNVLQGLGRHEEAAEAYRRTLDLMPTAAETQRNLGMVLGKMGRLREAVAAFRRALELQPDWPTAYNNLVTGLLEEQSPQAAVAASDAWLGFRPGDTEALSFKALALIEAGEADAARFLLDYDRLVLSRRWQAPAAFATLADFNRALVAHVLDHPTLRVPDQDHPTYHHPALAITEDLLAEPKGPMAYLEEMMLAAVEAYYGERPEDAAHPFLAGRPKRWRLVSWAAVLEGEGNLVPHIHLDGYLSGVYYAQMPMVVGAPGAGQAGWFEVGRPPDDLPCRAAPLVRAYRPEEGLMLLFPAYIYHRTVPYRSGEPRVSIAIDVIAEA